MLATGEGYRRMLAMMVPGTALPRSTSWLTALATSPARETSWGKPTGTTVTARLNSSLSWPADATTSTWLLPRLPVTSSS